MKFLHLLNIAKKDSMPDKERIRQRALRAGRSGALRVLSVITAAVLMLGLLSGGIYFGIMSIPTASVSDLPEELKGISPISAVSATNMNGNEITADTQLKVVTSNAMSVNEFKDAFVISPSEHYSVKKNTGNTFTVSFEQGLAANTLYTVSSVSDGKTIYSWAFQTDNSFGIVSRLPSSDILNEGDIIALDFTHSNVENFEHCFSIYPAIPGTFEHYGRRWVFVPSAEFEPNAMYTVTINKNIRGGDGETLLQDYKFSFTVQDPDSYIFVSYTSDEPADCFLPNQTPAARIEYANFELGKPQVTVYRVPTAEEYTNIHKNYIGLNSVSSAVADKLKSYDKVIDFTGDFAKSNDSEAINRAFLQYPQSFDNGYYISEIKSGDITLYHIFQITELAVYSVTSNGDYTVWVNSTSTSKCVENASVSIEGLETKKTDKNGVAFFKGKASDSDNSENIILSVKTENSTEYISSIRPTSKTRENDAAVNYYSYIYTDSELYRPGDKVKIWGFVIPRTDGAEKPQAVQIYTKWDDKYTDIQLSECGSFTATFELTGTCPDEYSEITVNNENVRLSSTGIYISDYTLPAYTLDISSDKNAYFDGEEIKYSVHASMFDNTPAANVTLQAEINGDSYEISTDKNGDAEFTQTAQYTSYSQSDENNVPSILSAVFTVTQPDGISENYYHSVSVFESDITAQFEKRNESIVINLYSVTLDKLNQKSMTGLGRELYMETADAQTYINKLHDTALRAELHKVEYSKSIADSVYNPVTMQVEHSYTYEPYDTVVKNDTLNTQSGKASFEFPLSSEDTHYYLLIYANGIEKADLCARYDIYENNIDSTFSYSLTADSEKYCAGDKISLKLTDSKTGAEANSGTLLLSGINADIITNEIYSIPTEISLNFDKLFMPSFCISGAYFDGNSVQLVQKLWITSEKSELDVEITADKAKYNPGENVNLNISVKDEEGEPQKADVNISVIDSALRELFLNEHDIYSDVYNPRLYLSDINRKVSTYLPEYQLDIPGGEGGGNGEYTRSDFELSPYFETITTDDAGKASASFKLPDSITSWSVTIQAFTNDANVGQAQTEIVSTKDFYLSVNAGKIKTSDDAVFPIKFTAPRSDTEDARQCSYTAQLSKDGSVIDTKSGAAEINSVISENFGKLAAGTYTLKLEAQYGEYSDSLSVDFTVKDSFTDKSVTSRQSIGSKTKLDTKFNSDITVSIYDENYDFYFTVLDTLLNVREDRLEQVIGKATARAYAAGLKNGQLLPSDMSALKKYQSDDKLSLFQSSEYMTPEASAKITAVAANALNTEIQKSYYYEILQSTPTVNNALYSYWALAVLGEPVLNDLKVYSDKIDTLTDEETLCLALAFAYAGDYKSARALYDAKISEMIKTANGISNLSANTAYDTENLTGLATILSVKISAPEAKSLTKYILGCDNLTGSKNIILTAFLQSYIPYLKGENSIEITYADGKSEKITYAKTGSAVIKIPYEDIDKTSFTSVSGTSVLTAFGNAPVSSVSEQYNDISELADITINVNGDISAGQKTLITVTAQLPQDTVTDASVYVKLPYCMKIISAEAESGASFLPQDKTEVRLYFENGRLNVTLECYASLAGEFTIEPAVMTDMENETFAVSDKMIITVSH